MTEFPFSSQIIPVYGDQGIPAGEPGRDYERVAKMWLEAAYEESKLDQSQQDESQKFSRYVDYIVGKQWSGNRPSYRAAPVDNRTWGLFWELVSTLTDIRPIFAVKPITGEDKALVQAGEMITKTVKGWWMESDGDLSLALIIIYALLTTGYAKLTWNEDLRNGYGDFEIVPCGPSEILPLKPRLTLDSAQAVIYQTPQPLGWFRKKFPTRAPLVKADPNYSRYTSSPTKPGHVPNMLFDMLSPQMKRVIGGPQRFGNSVYPAALYREFWLKDYSINSSTSRVPMGNMSTNWGYWVDPGEMLYPRGRLICMGGDAIMHDGPNPYWHGEFPFVDLRMNIVPWQFMGLSEIAPLMPLQDIINNILAGVLDMIKKAVNPTLMGPKNAFSESLWNSIDPGMPGAKIGYNANIAQKPEYSVAPNLPSFVMQVLGLASREMDRTSGIAAVSAAVNKKQIPSDASLEKIQESQQTPLRLKGRNLEVFLRGLGRRSIWNTFQFYTEKRMMFQLGTGGMAFDNFAWDPRSVIPPGMDRFNFARNFSFLIHPDSLLDLRRTERAFTIMRLRLMHDIDRRTMYKELDMGIDVDTVERNLAQEQQEAQAMAASGGGMPRVPKRTGRM